MPDGLERHPLDEVERLKREPFQFNCLGMGCLTTLLVLAALLAGAYLLRSLYG